MKKIYTCFPVLLFIAFIDWGSRNQKDNSCCEAFGGMIKKMVVRVFSGDNSTQLNSPPFNLETLAVKCRKLRIESMEFFSNNTGGTGLDGKQPDPRPLETYNFFNIYSYCGELDKGAYRNG